MSRGHRIIVACVVWLASQLAMADTEANSELFKRAYDYCFNASQLLYKKDAVGALQAFQQYQSLSKTALQADPSLVNDVSLSVEQKQAFCERVEARLRAAQALPFLELAGTACAGVKQALKNKDYAAARSEWARFSSARERAALIAPDVLSANLVLGGKIKHCDKLLAKLDPPAVQLPKSSLAAAQAAPVAESGPEEDNQADIKQCQAMLAKAKASTWSNVGALSAQWRKAQKEFAQPAGNQVAACSDQVDSVIASLSQVQEVQQNQDSFRREFERALVVVRNARESCAQMQSEIKPVGNTPESLRQIAQQVKSLQQTVSSTKIRTPASDPGQRASVSAVEMEKSAFDSCLKSITAKLAANEQKVAFVAELTSPKIIKRVDPVVPKQAKQKDISGWVTLEYKVGVDGRANDIKVVAASPKGMFEQAAMEAIRQWQFEPAKQNGIAVEANASDVLRFED